MVIGIWNCPCLRGQPYAIRNQSSWVLAVFSTMDQRQMWSHWTLPRENNCYLHSHQLQHKLCQLAAWRQGSRLSETILMYIHMKMLTVVHLGWGGDSSFGWVWKCELLRVKDWKWASEGIESGGPSSTARSDSGVPRAEGSFSGPSKHAIEHDDVGTEAKCFLRGQMFAWRHHEPSKSQQAWERVVLIS